MVGRLLSFWEGLFSGTMSINHAIWKSFPPRLASEDARGCWVCLWESSWAVLSDEHMSKTWPFSLPNNEQMSTVIGWGLSTNQLGIFSAKDSANGSPMGQWEWILGIKTTQFIAYPEPKPWIVVSNLSLPFLACFQVQGYFSNIRN